MNFDQKMSVAFKGQRPRDKNQTKYSKFWFKLVRALSWPVNWLIIIKNVRGLYKVERPRRKRLKISLWNCQKDSVQYSISDSKIPEIDFT